MYRQGVSGVEAGVIAKPLRAVLWPKEESVCSRAKRTLDKESRDTVQALYVKDALVSQGASLNLSFFLYKSRRLFG